MSERKAKVTETKATEKVSEAKVPATKATKTSVLFSTLGLDPRLTEGLPYEEPSPVQVQTIPVVLSGKDLVGLSGTGTGKTAAFALPAIHRLITEFPKRKGVGILILTPTRELAIQVAKAVKTYGKPVGIDVVAVYGGTAYGGQIQAIRNGVDVVVATPGRALDLYRKGKFPLEHVHICILDEADEMLDMGFADDIDAMLSATPKERQTLLFSATMPPRIEEIAKKHLKKPTRIAIERTASEKEGKANVRHTAYMVRREHKLIALGRILDIEQPTSALVFCRTRSDADELTEMLASHQFQPIALHGGLTQEQRDKVMQRFRAGQANLLIATDIAARGLDISHLSHVINFDVPEQAEAYTHRTGRVGRAGREGVAITLVTPPQRSMFHQIERFAQIKITVSPVPDFKAVQAARMQQTKQMLLDLIAKGDVNSAVRGLLGELEETQSTQDIALAALKILSAPARSDDSQVIPDMRTESAPYRSGPPQRGDRDIRGGTGRQDERKRAGSRPTRAGMVKIYLGIGRDFGVSPGDIVGAIANEVGIPGKDLGAIDITDRFSLIEVPEDVADYVVDTMQNTRIRGRRVMVRHDRPPKS